MIERNKKFVKNINITYILVFLISLVSSFAITKICYSIFLFNNIDIYKEFILGDTVFSNYSKDVDFMVIKLFMILFFIIFLTLLYIVKRYCKINDEFEITIKTLFFNDNIYKNTIIFLLAIFLSYYAANIILKLLSKYSLLELNNFKIILLTILLSTISIVLINKKGIMIPQLFLPLVFIELLLNSKIIIDNIEYSIVFSNNLKLFAILCIIISYIFIFISLKKNYRISFSTIVFFLFLANVSINSGSFLYPLDEYHNGEVITSYQQIFELDQDMYTSYVPVKGFSHIIIGFVNEIFFDGNYMSLSLSFGLSSFIILTICCFIFQYYIGRGYTLLIILAGLIPRSDYLLIPVFLLVLSDKRINTNPISFIIAYCYMSFIYIMYYQSFGMAFAGSLLPVIIIKMISIFKNKIIPNKYQILLLIFGILLFILSFDEIVGIIDYALTNSRNNKYYWGNSSGFNNSDEFWIKFIKSNIWVLLWIITFIYFIKNNKEIRNKYIFYFYILFPIIIFSYMYGRHDGIMARVERYSIFSIQIIYIFLFYNIYNKKSRYSKCFLIILFLFSFTNFYPFNFNLNMFNLANNINFNNVYQYDSSYTFIKDSNIPNLKEGIIPIETYNSINKEFLLIDTLLEEDETFLVVDDYVTQSARYYIYNKKIPTISHSMLNITSIKSQIEEIKKVKNSNVKIIRYTPNGLKRYYIFYDYYLSMILDKNFVNIEYGGYNYLIDKDKFIEYKDKLGLVEKEIDLNSLSTREFGYLPLKWGKGYNNTKEDLLSYNYTYNIKDISNIKEVSDNKFKILDNKDPFIVYELEENINGDFIDYISYDFNSNSNNKNTVCSIYWAGEDGIFDESKKVFYNQENGKVVVPIGMNTNWKILNDIKYIRIDFENYNTGDILEIINLEFMQQTYLNRSKVIYN